MKYFLMGIIVSLILLFTACKGNAQQEDTAVASQQLRIPGDERIRAAVDPVSGKKVDKADAVIAITGDNGDVSYFENKANYQSFFEQ